VKVGVDGLRFDVAAPNAAPATAAAAGRGGGGRSGPGAGGAGGTRAGAGADAGAASGTTSARHGGTAEVYRSVLWTDELDRPAAAPRTPTPTRGGDGGDEDYSISARVMWFVPPNPDDDDDDDDVDDGRDTGGGRSNGSEGGGADGSRRSSGGVGDGRGSSGRIKRLHVPPISVVCVRDLDLSVRHFFASIDVDEIIAVSGVVASLTRSVGDATISNRGAQAHSILTSLSHSRALAHKQTNKQAHTHTHTHTHA
jgi:hypothetical protein